MQKKKLFHLICEIVSFTILIILEIAVVFIEAVVYHVLLKEKFSKCLLISFIINTMTFGIGVFISFLDYGIGHFGGGGAMDY